MRQELLGTRKDLGFIHISHCRINKGYKRRKQSDEKKFGKALKEMLHRMSAYLGRFYQNVSLNS